ncbi:YaaC family protein [Streptosporangium sp. G12]
MASVGTAFRNLRALRHDPPGYAKQGARRTTFQSALEQCEQFLGAAGIAGYATRPVQLFYALSQAGRAIVVASPNVGNQGWRVSGHGLTANTNALLGVPVASAKFSTDMQVRGPLRTFGHSLEGGPLTCISVVSRFVTTGTPSGALAFHAARAVRDAVETAVPLGRFGVQSTCRLW